MTTTTTILDFETRSEADLRQVGAWAYSEHPSTEVICASWVTEEGSIQSWLNPLFDETGDDDRCDQDPLLRDVWGPYVLVEAHNVAFEYAIWHNVCVKKYGWPIIPVGQWRDTMAVACYYALPPALGNLLKVLGLPPKDPAGDRLITKYSKLHLKTAEKVIPALDVESYIHYCETDVERERDVANILGDLPEEEEIIFCHDFEIAATGIHLDLAGVAQARQVVKLRAVDLEREFRELTGLKPGQRDKILHWLAERGLSMENLQADTIAELLEEPGGQMRFWPRGEVRRALEIRRQHSHASTKKLDAMARQCGTDGWARFQTRYHGAVTGRNTGSGFQPLNLSRGFEGIDPEQLVRDVAVGDPAWLDALYGDAMEAIGKASRHWITASEGCRIISGDFANIEARVLACLAGEEWKIQAFREGVPIYELTADKIYGFPAGTISKKTHPRERQDGKTCELAFGYQGALGAWRRFDNSDRHTDERVIEICKAWRAEHPCIVGLWRALENAAVNAVRYPGAIYRAGESPIYFERVDGWLTMILPDSKRLWYWAPQLRLAMPRWHNPDEQEDCAAGTCECQPRPAVTYEAQKEGRWRRVWTYGGKLSENATQATSRQILKAAELRVKAAGYPVIFSVYDEVICNVSLGRGSKEELRTLMEIPAGPWCENWPILVDEEGVWEGGRYKK